MKETTWTEQRKMYEDAASKFLNGYVDRYGVAPSHIVDVVVSVMMTRDEVMQGGGFVQAVCKNDLRGAATHADLECIRWIVPIAVSYDWAHID